MRHFCTYFDSRYLLHGLAMFRSLQRHAGEFRLYVLCLDDKAFEFLARCGLEAITPIRLSDLEAGDDALLAAKKNRSLAEYYFTLSPCLPLHVMNRYPEVRTIAYLDADLYFFAPIDPIYEELGSNSILIIPHRFSEAWREAGERHGIYNVGYLVFRNDERGRRCLDWWRERCLEWCYDVLEEKRFADQKYLDDWPARFEGVVVLQHKGANLARWNCMNFDLRLLDGRLRVDGQSLIFYHYNSFRILSRWLFDPDYPTYDVKKSMPPQVRRWLFRLYAREIRDVWRWVRGRSGAIDLEFVNIRHGSLGWSRLAKRLLAHELLIAVGPYVI